MTRSVQPVITRSKGLRIGIIPTLSPVDGKIDLNLFIPTGAKPLFRRGDTLKPTLITLIEDGQPSSSPRKIGRAGTVSCSSRHESRATVVSPYRQKQ